MENGGKFGFFRENRILFVVFVLLVAVIIGLAVFIVKLPRENTIDQTETTNIEDTGISKEVEDYINEINTKIEAASTNEEKAELYAEKAGNLYNYYIGYELDLKSEILESGYMAEELSPSAQTAYSLYIYESEFGDTKKADMYLNLAKERGIDKIEGMG